MVHMVRPTWPIVKEVKVVETIPFVVDERAELERTWMCLFRNSCSSILHLDIGSLGLLCHCCTISCEVFGSCFGCSDQVRTSSKNKEQYG